MQALPKMKFSAKVIIILLSTLSFISAYSLTDRVKTYHLQIEDYKAVVKQVGNAWSNCWLVEWGGIDTPETEKVHGHTQPHKHNMFITCGK